MNDNDRKLLEDNGWEIECELPFEIRCEESFAANQAAWIVLNSLRKLQLNKPNLTVPYQEEN